MARDEYMETESGLNSQSAAHLAEISNPTRFLEADDAE